MGTGCLHLGFVYRCRCCFHFFYIVFLMFFIPHEGISGYLLIDSCPRDEVRRRRKRDTADFGFFLHILSYHLGGCESSLNGDERWPFLSSWIHTLQIFFIVYCLIFSLSLTSFVPSLLLSSARFPRDLRKRYPSAHRRQSIYLSAVMIAGGRTLVDTRSVAVS
jgi:hypothetical protein